MHNVIGWDHKPPNEFRKAAKDQLQSHYNTIIFENTPVEKMEKLPNGRFKAIDAEGQAYESSAVILANGVRDVLPDIEGYEHCWGKGIFHCLFCHGYEERGAESVGVLAIGFCANAQVALHLSHMSRNLAKHVVIYTDGDAQLAEEVTAQVKDESNITIENRKIARLDLVASGPEVDVRFEVGEKKREGFLTHGPYTEQSAPFAKQLGLELTPTGDIKTEAPFNATSVPGIYAAGDCATPFKSVVQAMQMGTFAAVGTVTYLASQPVLVMEA